MFQSGVLAMLVLTDFRQFIKSVCIFFESEINEKKILLNWDWLQMYNFQENYIITLVFTVFPKFWSWNYMPCICTFNKFNFSVREQVQKNSSKVDIQIIGQFLWTPLDFGLITDMLPMFYPFIEAVKDLEFLIGLEYFNTW